MYFIVMSTYSCCMFMYLHRASWHSSATRTELDWSLWICLTQLFDDRDMYRIYYIKNNYMFRHFTLAIVRLRNERNLVSSYTRLMWVASTLTNSYNLELEVVRTSETSEHLTTTSRRSPGKRPQFLQQTPWKAKNLYHLILSSLHFSGSG